MSRTDRPTSDEQFAAFVTGSARRLLHAADLLTGDRARAEDLLQHAYAKAYEHWASVRGGAPEAYVRRAMLNRHLDWWRRLRPREAPLLDADLDRVRAPDPAADVGRRDAVLRALAGLTDKERAVVVLRYWLDLSEAQIAAELRIAPGTVKSTCARALARLRTDPNLAPEPLDAPAGGHPMTAPMIDLSYDSLQVPVDLVDRSRALGRRRRRVRAGGRVRSSPGARRSRGRLRDARRPRWARRARSSVLTARSSCR